MRRLDVLALAPWEGNDAHRTRPDLNQVAVSSKVFDQSAWTSASPFNSTVRCLAFSSDTNEVGTRCEDFCVNKLNVKVASTVVL